MGCLRSDFQELPLTNKYTPTMALVILNLYHQLKSLSNDLNDERATQQAMPVALQPAK